ncbi:hypothetical protein CJF31_00007694 [Rutstroemia sp. NJR-2017a BVV2]|nr:hypothetical protein CJF31_00008696 [Rutstroemia sp. NJR-2017a BVV2]PQE21830.1 hypothetical protein CJF31_00007694 [Rutstroemia sp. NJR-2017a BVV2]
MRRNGSTSSAGSSVAGSVRSPPAAALVRRGSSGSMTERTFREQSPSRSSPVPSAIDAPPVPAIPKNIGAPAVPAKSSRRAASMDSPGLRIASPPPFRTGGRGSSVEPKSSSPVSVRRPGTSSSSGTSEPGGAARSESRGSVNFSLPTSTRPMSPNGQRQLTLPESSRANPRIVSPNNQNLVYDPNTRSFLPLAEILAIEQGLNDAANAPVKKKKRIATKQAEGTHLADGTVGGRLKGTAVDTMTTASKLQPAPQPVSPKSPKRPQSQSTIAASPSPARAVPRVETEVKPVVTSTTPQQTSTLAPSPIIPKKKKKRVVINDDDSDQASLRPNSSDDSDASIQSYSFHTRAGALLAKKPSVVREDREREEEEDDSPLRLKPGEDNFQSQNEVGRTISPSPTPLPRSSAGRGHGQAQASAAFAKSRQHTRSASQPAPMTTPDPVLTGMSLPVGASARGGRVQSVSPTRTAHFVATPETLVVRHQPPPRSISPRKSALKHSSVSSNSPRGPSPIDGHSPRASMVSNDSSSVADEQPKKKGNRVSFDEASNVVLGQSVPIVTDSPVIPSPQTSRRGWFSMGRGKKKDTSVMDDNDDEVMKPRPALPSFGSVREKKASREVEERPLVRPLEQVQSTQPVVSIPSPTSPSSPSIFTTPTGEAMEFPLGQSHDHVTGAVLVQDATSKNAANISKSREPLPPEVTTVEGTGEVSDVSTIYSVDEDHNIGIATSHDTDARYELVEEESDDDQTIGDIPEIAIQQPTPTLDSTKAKEEWPGMPGSFPFAGSSNSNSAEQSQDETSPSTTTNPTHGISSAVGTAPVTQLPEETENREREASPLPEPILEETEESESESIYSDAAEDLTAEKSAETEGADGFMSLDAVVESPAIDSTPNGSAFGIVPGVPESPTSRATKERAYMRSQLQRKSSEPDAEEGWDKAQQYWKGLPDERKRQLEQEAQRYADADAESEEEVAPVQKPKKKKKVVKVVVPTESPTTPAQPVTKRTYMIEPGAKAGPNGHVPTMRSSMRAEPPHASTDFQMRKSMRGNGAVRNGPRNDTVQSNGAVEKRRGSASLPAEDIRANPQAVNTHLQQMTARGSAGALPATARRTSVASLSPPLRRRGSGDSDTSFKRSRPASEGISLRRSMRGGNESSIGGRQQSPIQSGRRSLRSPSPGGAMQVTMRTSMRSSMRNSADLSSRAKSPIRLPGFGRSSSARPAETKKPAPSRSSRFADSSDEEEPRHAFRSRFADSSDEDEPSPVLARPPSNRGAPLRSIPRPAGYQDGDSSDLPDSDDDRPPTARSLKKTQQQNGARPSSQGNALASGTLQRSGSGRGMMNTQGTISTATAAAAASRPQQTRRGSLLSIFRKKPDPNTKVRKSVAESPARRDTPLERSKSDLAVIKGLNGNAGVRPMSPKLVKRNVPAAVVRRNSGAWPLPGGGTGMDASAEKEGEKGFEEGGGGEGLTDGEGEKDAINGINGNGNGNHVGARKFSATSTGLEDGDAGGGGSSVGSPRKKKKFQALRKMFRLDD